MLAGGRLRLSPLQDQAPRCSYAFLGIQPARSKPGHMKRLRILLADDHKIIRGWIEAAVNERRTCHVVGEAGNGLEVLEKARDLNRTWW